MGSFSSLLRVDVFISRDLLVYAPLSSIQLKAIATYPNSLVFINAIPSNLSAFAKQIVEITCTEVKNIAAGCGQDQIINGAWP